MTVQFYWYMTHIFAYTAMAALALYFALHVSVVLEVSQNSKVRTLSQAWVAIKDLTAAALSEQRKTTMGRLYILAIALLAVVAGAALITICMTAMVWGVAEG